jgi:hypothetical protein
LHAIEVRGLEPLRAALRAVQGVLITPNHFTYTYPSLLSTASDQLGHPFYFMTAWQVFATSGWLKRLVLRQHGCFSLDRDGTDLRPFRQAVAILQDRPAALVIFPKGEMYHVGDRGMPLSEGPASIALAAAKRAHRPIVCFPCALKYYFLADPTPQLQGVMERLERSLYWRPWTDMTLEQRLFQVAEPLRRRWAARWPSGSNPSSGAFALHGFRPLARPFAWAWGDAGHCGQGSRGTVSRK